MKKRRREDPEPRGVQGGDAETLNQVKVEGLILKLFMQGAVEVLDGDQGCRKAKSFNPECSAICVKCLSAVKRRQ
jgi:hypothetical protein